MAKFIISNHKAVNLSNVDEFSVSCNYLKLTTGGGLNAREVNFVYGTESNLVKLFDAIVDFIANDKVVVFDCDEFMKTL